MKMDSLNEMTRADMTAVVMFQAALPVPVEVVPKDREVRHAAELGRREFGKIGCATCHIPALPLDRKGWIFSEPNPYNPPANLQLGQVPSLKLDLTSNSLPGHRLKPDHRGLVWVPAFTDLKLHDITTGPGRSQCRAAGHAAAAGDTRIFCGESQISDAQAVGNSQRSTLFPSRAVYDDARGCPGAFRRGFGFAT